MAVPPDASVCVASVDALILDEWEACVGGDDGVSVSNAHSTLVGRLRSSSFYVSCPSLLSELCRCMPPDEELLVGVTFSPDFVDACCREGCFPMTVEVCTRVELFAMKWHIERCVVFLRKECGVRLLGRSDPCSVSSFDHRVVGVNKRLLRRVNRSRNNIEYRVRVNNMNDVVPVFTLVRNQHGETWLTHRLRRCLMHMLLHPENFRAQVIIVAILEVDSQMQANEGACGRGVSTNACKVIAGEIGYRLGRIYTSMTGAFSVSGAGALQLAVTGALLAKLGCVVWDLGMHLSYKEKMLHSVLLDRVEWARFITLYGCESEEDVPKIYVWECLRGVYGLLCAEVLSGSSCSHSAD